MDLEGRVRKVFDQAVSLEGRIYRSATPKYANSSDLLTGEGSKKFGGRWNPVGLAAVYGSFTPQTALEETLAHSRYYNLPVHAAMPRTFVAIEFSVQKVLDLTNGRIRQALAVSEKRLLGCDWRREMARGKTAISQQVGAAAAAAGFEALLVRSAAADTGENLVIFVEILAHRSRPSVLAADKL